MDVYTDLEMEAVKNFMVVDEQQQQSLLNSDPMGDPIGGPFGGPISSNYHLEESKAIMD